MICPVCDDRDPTCDVCALYKPQTSKAEITQTTCNLNANISARDLLDLHRFWRETGSPAVMCALLRTQPDRIKAAFEHFGLIDDYERLLSVVEALRGLKLRRADLNAIARRLITDCTDRFDKAFDFFVKEQERWSVN